MKSNKEFELMLELERTINALTKYASNQVEYSRNEEQFSKWYAIETLCRAMTSLKCSISTQLDKF